MKCISTNLSILFFIASLAVNAQRIINVAGGSGDGGPALSADLFGPTSVAVDQTGNVFIADSRSRTIRKIDVASGKISVVAGNGKMESSGNGGLALDAAFGEPSGIAVDVNGNLYISDQLYNTIRKVDASTGVITQIAGDGGAGFTGDNILASQARINVPHTLMVRTNGDIYFTDTGNHRIRKIDASTGIITTVAGNGIYGFSGDNGPATSASISNASSICFDSNGNFYIADYGNYRIRRVSATTSTITTVAGNGSAGSTGDGGLATQAQLFYPLGVIINNNGNLLVTDDSRIREVNLTTGIITTFAGTGVSGFLDDVLMLAQFETPQHLAIDNNGSIYTNDYSNRRIRKITSSNVTTIAGNGGFDGDNGPALDATLQVPRGIAVDIDGNIFIADSYNHRIRKVDKSTGNITTISGNGDNTYNGDGGLAINTQLNLPLALILDKDGNLIVADAQNNRIRKIDQLTGVISTIVGNGSLGYSGDGGLAVNATINYPTAFAFDSNNNLYIADSHNHVIRKVNALTGIITTVVGIGTAGLSGDGGVALNAQLNFPSGIKLDKDDNIFIVDSWNYRIRKVSATNNIITTVAGGGNSSSDGLALDAFLVNPQDVILDSLNNLLILENSTIRKVDFSTGIISTLFGGGRGYFGDGIDALKAYFDDQSNFVIDSFGNIYICDSGNNRIRKIKARSYQTISFGPIPDKTFGDPNFQLTASASSSLPITFTSSNINVGEISGSTVKIVGGGSIIISALQAGDLDYLPSPIVTQTLTVNKAAQSITFNALPNKVLGESPFNLTATSTSGLSVAYTTTTTSKLSINGNQVTLISPGNANLTASQPGNDSYLPASNVSFSFCINPHKPLISITDSNTESPKLTSDATAGNQWFKDENAIEGATTQTITVTEPGIYSVQVTIESCSSAMSSDFPMIVTGDLNQTMSGILKIFPNPAYNDVTIGFPSRGLTQIYLFNSEGKAFKQIRTDQNEVSIDASDLTIGLYIVRIKTESGIYFGKFFKK